MHINSAILSVLLVLPAAVALSGRDGKWRASRSCPKYAAKLDYELKKYNFTLIPRNFRPLVYLEAEFPESNAVVDFGNAVSIEDAKATPAVAFTAMPALYTLLVLDPDAPSRSTPYWSPFLHYAQPGLVPKNGEVEVTSKVLVDWYPPAPPAGSGSHRYVFLLYLQPTLSVSLPASRPSVETEEDRMSFPFEDLIRKNELLLVGANYMVVNGAN
ncbi:hypothetical protein JCM5296_002644 [Sporobolomyces johnsonii]